jgi:hypothetical protein
VQRLERRSHKHHYAERIHRTNQTVANAFRCFWGNRNSIATTLVTTVVLYAVSVHFGKCASAANVTGYSGGKSTPLRAFINIATSDKVPMGIIFGARQNLCEEERDYNFLGMSTFQALSKVAEGTGYAVKLKQGVY